MMRGFVIAFGMLAATLTACGDDGGNKPAADAPDVVSQVETVACAGGEKGPINTAGTGTTADPYKYDPNALTIAVGDTVEFKMQAIHNVVPDAGSDPGVKANFGADVCIKFKAAGDYKFHCGPHGFKGTVTAQ